MRFSPLDLIERLGNRLPDPLFLFLFAALLVMALSALGSAAGWRAQPLRPVLAPQTAAAASPSARPAITLVPVGDPIPVRSLLSAEGLSWAMTSMVRNFINYPPLGVVLVGVLGVGLAERVGLFAALMKWLARFVPGSLLTPTMVFLGVMSSVAGDAGYLVLPTLATSLYIAVGRSPVAGLAAAFAGIAGGFSANLLVSAIDAVMADLTTAAARGIDPDVTVTAVGNWWFMAASAIVLTLVGWAVTAWVVEPRFRHRALDEGGPPLARVDSSASAPDPAEHRAILAAIGALLAVAALFAALILIPGWPLYGDYAASPTTSAPRWTQVVVLMILLAFGAPACAFGVASGALRTQRDLTSALSAAIAGMAPIIVIAFVAGQFLEYLKYSNLDKLVAYAGGSALVASGLPPALLLVALILVTLVIDLFINSMSAKWTMLAPIVVPMFMMLGLGPALTQAAYRVGDSVVNPVTPFNSYALIILVVLQRHWKSAGMGALIATMLPYSIAFTIVWILLLLAWIGLGIPLGPQTQTWYVPAH